MTLSSWMRDLRRDRDWCCGAFLWVTGAMGPSLAALTFWATALDLSQRGVVCWTLKYGCFRPCSARYHRSLAVRLAGTFMSDLRRGSRGSGASDRATPKAWLS